MLITLINRISVPKTAPKEGELYKTITVVDKCFDIYYGYYEDFEREHNDPIPIYPDLKKEPVYTKDNIPIVTGMQDTCGYFIGKRDSDSCMQCSYFQKCDDLFGLCTCPQNIKQPGS